MGENQLSYEQLLNRCLEAERLNAETTHIKQVLLAIRNVNQIIVSESDPQQLIEKTCACLTETMGYLNTWIVLLDQDGESASMVANSSIHKIEIPDAKQQAYQKFTKEIKEGRFPKCLKQALQSDETVVIEDPKTDCPECPISNFYGRSVAWSHRLAIGERVFGVLAVSIARHFSDDPEGRRLFEELARDLAYALQRIEDARIQKETELRYEQLFQSANDAVFLHELTPEGKPGRFIDANEKALKNLQYSREEIQNLSVLDVVDPDWQKNLPAVMDVFIKKGQITFESRHRRKDGTSFPVEVSAQIIEEGDHQQVLSIVRDISERHKNREIIKRSENRFQRMLDLVPDMISIHDPDMDIVYSNWKEFGAVPEEKRVLGGKCYRVYRGLDTICPDCQAKKVLETKEPIQKEIKLPEGNWVDLRVIPLLDEQGQVKYFMEWVRDITENKKAEDAYARVCRLATELICVADINTATFVQVNPAFEKVLGYSEEELLGRPFLDFIHPDDVQKTIDVLNEELQKGKEVIYFENRYRGKDGSYHYLEWNSHPSPEEGLTFAIAHDVTEQKRAEQEKEQLEVQYRQAQKMEAIGQLTGGVAHDFNNLLQVINAGAEMALQDLGAEHPARDILGEVFNAGERAARLVSQLLAFSRRQIMQPEVLDLNKVVTDILKMLQRIIGEHIRLEWIPGKHLGNVHGDRSMLEQALFNLCINARDAMPEGGVLTVETQSVLVDSDYCSSHAWAVPGRYILLSVTDTGCGMQEAILEHIFEPFFTTKEASRGTGLGLATVYGIVKQHEGMVNVYSELEKGSTFKIYLPACENRADRVGSLIQGPVKGGKETVLLAEDDFSVRNLATKILERAGYTVLVAEDGRESVEIFKKHRDQISLVLLDVVMPEMGGREAYEEMKALCPRLKALFASGYSENAIHTNFVLDRGLALLPKPYAPDTLLRKVREVLDQSPSSSE